MKSSKLMTFNDMKKKAHSIFKECIVDKDGDICIRDMQFDDEGKRIVLMRPDPCEFTSAQNAERILENKARAKYFLDILGTEQTN